MRKNVNIGRSLGHINAPEGILVQPREIDQFPDEKIVVISTGSQGEPLSALRRMAYRDHPAVELHDGDTVIFSATPIPGNERAVNEVIDRLHRVGCEVVTAKDAPIHASGHGYAEEIKLMLNLTHPRYVMPIHGDYKRLACTRRSRRRSACPRENIFTLDNGLPLEIDGKGARIGGQQTAGMVFVDGVDIGDVADVALRDRRMLSADGIFIVVATVSEQDGSSVVPPEVLARGVPFITEGDDSFLEELREAVEDALDRAAEQHVTEVDGSSRCSTTTSRTSSTTASSGARWCCRSSSRSRPARRRAPAAAGRAASSGGGGGARSRGAATVAAATASRQTPTPGHDEGDRRREQRRQRAADQEARRRARRG